MNADHTFFPAWIVMWLIAAVVFIAGKLFTLPKLCVPGVDPVTRIQYLLWIGMDPNPWRQRQTGQLLRAYGELTRSITFMLLGVFLVWFMARLSPSPWLAGWCGMIGLVCLLHFGLFHLVALFWQARGHPVKPIMNKPVLAVTLADFWSHRWNRAFHDLAHPYVFVPVLRQYGSIAALFSVFLVSGLVHELVISVPAQAGYGLPTLYFLLQAIGIVMQRRFRIRSWFFTHTFTALPAVVLFHPPFVERVILPFLTALHALP